MTTYYAVATGNWQGGNIWALSSGGAASVQTPTSADDVVFDLHSTGTVTIGTNSNCNNMTMVAPAGGTIAMGGTAILNIYGNMTLVSGMTFAPQSTAVINFLGTTTGLTVTHGGYSLTMMIYNGVGGEWTWQDNQTNSNAANVAITLTNGSLRTNNFNAGGTNGISFSSNNSNIRSLTLGTTTWKLVSSGAFSIWNLLTTTNLTFSGASSTITLGSTSTFNGGGLTYGTVQGLSLGNSDIFINGANTYTNLTLTLSSNSFSWGYRLGANQVVTGTFAANGLGVNAVTRTFVTSNVKGTQRTITAAAVSASYLDLQDIVGAGAASWDLHAITGLSGDCGGNSGITFTSPSNQYFHTATSTSWATLSKWFLATNGGGGAGHFPLPQDTAIFDANSVTSGSLSISIDTGRLSKMDWTGVANSPTLAHNNGSVVTTSIFGDIILASGMTLTGNNLMVLEKRGAITYAFAGLTIPWAVILDNATGIGSWSLNSTLTLSFTLAVNSGTLSTNGHNITGCTTFTLAGGVVNLDNQILCSAGIALSGGTTVDAGASGEYKGTTFSCTGGTHTLRKVTLSSTFAQSGGYIEVPIGGTISFATSWTWIGSTFEFKTLGLADWLVDVLTVTAPASTGTSYAYYG